MRAAELIATLRARGVKLKPAGTSIAFEAPRGALTPALRAEVVEHKAEVLAILKPADADRLDLADCMALIAETFDSVRAEYIEGAVSVLKTNVDLAGRFKATEAAVDDAVVAGPTEAQLRAALAAHVEVIRECCWRQRARREQAA